MMISAETVDRLARFRGDGVPVVSAYVGYPVDDTTRGRSPLIKVSSLLHEIRPLADDERLSHDARLSLRADIEQIEGTAAEGRWPRGAVAVFSSSRSGLFEVLELPRAVRDRIVVDATPWVRPMLALLEDYPRAVVVVVDRANARMWEYFVEELEELGGLSDPTLRKPNYGGWYGLEERRVENKAETLERKHFRRVADHLLHLFLGGTYDVLVVGGHPDEVARFVEFLPAQVRPKLAGTFTIDPGTMTKADLKHRAREIVETHERATEAALVEDVLGLAAAGGLATTGLASCLWAGSVLAIQHLLVQDEAVAPGVVCDECGWLGLTGEECPVSGDKTRPTDDVVDELTTSVIDHSGTVTHVETETALAEHTTAARLRFPLPAGPDAVQT
jgi:peptide chain release factor subunit 1